MTPLTKAGDIGAGAHYWPQFLPDGERVLFHHWAGAEPQGVYVSDVRSRSTRFVGKHDGRAMYAAGHLLIIRDGMLFAEPVDPQTLQPTGEPIRIADSVGHFGGSFGEAAVTVSESGVLAYGPRVVLVTSLQWRNRHGDLIAQATTPSGAHRSPLLAADERTVVFSLLDPNRSEGADIWMSDLGRGTLTRLTTDPLNDWFPVWSPGGTHLYFGSTRAGSTSIFRKAPGAPEEPLTERGPFGRYPTDITRDGSTLVYHAVASDGYDLGLVQTTEPRTPRTFLATRFNEVQGRLSPDERWLAYASDESGRFEVYVRPFPEGAAQYTVSVAGGMQPRWRRDGQELFYLAPGGRMAVPVTSDGPTFSATAPQPLFDVEVPEPGAPFSTDYDVSADGQRLLVNTVIEQASRPSITVILNWAAELKQ